MICADLYHSPHGPRWRVVIGYDDHVDPEVLQDVARRAPPGVTDMLVLWYLRDGASRGRFVVPLAMARSAPGTVLEAMVRALARSAVKNGIEHHLPRQFYTPEVGEGVILGLDGRPLRREDLQ